MQVSTRQNPLVRLGSFGQSVWLDFISRELIESGRLQRFVEEDGLKGVTSNPSIFHKALSAGSDYDTYIEELTRQGKTPPEIADAIMIRDVRRAADVLAPVYERTHGGDGFVSLEVSPHLANDTAGTIKEARRLWAKLDRPNVMIKVPGTTAGLGAIRELTGEGVNVNVTLLFSPTRYRDVAEAYVEGLEDRVGRREPIDEINSVASFFISRIDTMVDPMLDEIAHGPDVRRADTARRLVGEVAIACARSAYAIFKSVHGNRRFMVLGEHGARPQRLLWASTSTKNPAYRDTKYVEPLIGPFTVNTMPLETLEAYRDHGDPANRLELELHQSQEVLDLLAELGIRFDAVAAELERQGVAKFVEPYEAMLAALAGWAEKHVGVTHG